MANPINFVTHIDNSQLKKDAAETLSILDGIGNSAQLSGESFDTAIEGITQNINTLNKMAEEIRANINNLVPDPNAIIPDEVADTVARLYTELGILNDELRNQQLQLQLVREAQTEAASGAQTLISGYTSTSEAITVLENAAEQAEAALRQLYESENLSTDEGYAKYMEAARGLDDINRALVEQRAELAATTQTQKELNTAQGAYSDAGEGYRAHIEEQQRLLVGLQQSLRDTNSEINRLEQALREPLTDSGIEAATQKLEQQRNIQRDLSFEILQTKDNIASIKKEYADWNREQDRAAKSSTTLRTQLMSIRNEMGQLILAGQQNTKQYRDLEAELKRLGTAYRETERSQRLLTQGGQQFAGVLQGVQALTGAFAALRGITGLVVSDNEELVKIQTQLQSVLGIIIGLQQVQNALHSTSAFRLQTVRKATDLWTAANTRLSSALRISTTAARGFMIAITGGLAIAIPIVIELFNRWRESQRAVREEQERISKAQEDLNNSIQSNSASLLAQFRALQQSWASLNGDISAQSKFIEENSKAFDGLGVSINNINDAETLFVSKSDQFTLALQQRARATAQMQAATEMYATAYRQQMQYIERSNLLDTGRATEWTSALTKAWEEAQKQARKERGTIFAPTAEDEENLRKRVREIFTGSIDDINKLFQNADNLFSSGLQTQKTAEQIVAELGLAPIKDTKKALQDYYKELDRIQEEVVKQRQSNQRLQITDPNELIEFDTQISIKAIEQQERALLNLRANVIGVGSEFNRLGREMREAFRGNVDLLARPLIDAAELVRKGWEDAGEGIATVFSSQYGVENLEGKVVEILVTPILPDGTVLSQQELEDYIYGSLEGVEDILEADSLGLVIAIDVDDSGNAGERLHLLQERYYDLKQTIESGIDTSDYERLINLIRANSDIRITQNNEAEAKKQQQEFNALIGEYQSYADRRLAIEAKYDADILSLQIAGYNQQAEAARQARDKELQELENDLFRQSDIYKRLFSDIDNLGPQALRTLFEEASKAVRENTNLTIEEVARLEKRLQQLKNILRQLNPFGQLKTDYQDLIDASEDGDPNKVVAAWRNLGDSLGRTSQQVSGIAGSVTGLLETFGVEIPDALNESINGVIQFGTGLAELAGSIASGDIGGAIAAGVKALAGAVQAISAALSGDAKRERQIKRIQKNIDELAKSYERLSKEIEDAYSHSAADLYRESNENLRLQGELIQQQLDKERSKKKSDNDRIKELEAEYERIQGLIADNERSAVDAIFGNSVQDAISDFANAYVNAWGAGEDKIAATQDIVRQMIQGVIRQLLNDKLADAVARLRAMIEKAFEDEFFSDKELEEIYRFGNSITEGLEEEFKKFDDLFKTENGETGSATARGIAQASQDSVDELNGRFTVIQGHTYQMTLNTNELVEMGRVETNNSNLMLYHLAAIHQNTNRLADVVEFLDAMTHRGINIADNG